MHPTRFQALASLFPAATHSHFVTQLEGAACHPRVRFLRPLRSDVPLGRHKARVLQPANLTRRVARVMWRRRLLPHRSLVAPSLWLSLPLHPCRALRITRHAHATTPPSCHRWPPTPLDSTKPCLPYTNRWSYGLEATPDVRGSPSAAASEHWLRSFTGV